MVADVRSALAEVAKGLAGLDLPADDVEAILHGRNPGSLSEEKSLALIGFDADSVQAQVFASPRPITIQGASAGLRDWDEKLKSGKTLGEDAVVLFAGGGQAVVLARREHVDGITKTLNDKFIAHASRWPCTIARVELSPRELVTGPPAARGLQSSAALPPAARGPKISGALARRLGWSPEGGGGYGACMARLALAMREKKGQATRHPFLDSPSTAARCEECAERPRIPSGTRCKRCQKNRERGGGDNHAWGRARSFDEVLGEPGPSGEAPLRERHLAFLKLDGKGIGAVLERLHTVAQYTAVSATLRRAFELRDLTQTFGVPEGRYQIPIAGGDDLLLVLPARWQNGDTTGDVFTLADKLIEHIEGTFDDADLDEPFRDDRALLNDVRRIGAGAGLVITSGMPASFCFDYAGELVTSAKNAIEGDARSAIDFAVLSGGSPLAHELRELRRRAVLDLDLGPGLTGKVLPTRCPYTAAKYKHLLDRTRGLAGVPRSALHALRAALREPTTGMIAVHYQIARHTKLRAALVDGAGAVPGHDLGPWVLAPAPAPGASWATALPDLLDAWPFVTAAAPEEEDPA